MSKVDLKKQFKTLYGPSAEAAVIVDVPTMNYLMVDGKGDPNNAPQFHDAIDLLYGTAYTMKFTLKKNKNLSEYTVMPLEGLWWMDNVSGFSMENKDLWEWTLMIAQPDFITKDMVEAALEEMRKKKPWTAKQALRLESLDEGISAQIMHMGPYSEEPPTIKKLHEFVETEGYELTGKHHETYLSDPRRCQPEKLKTVIRNPVKKK